jgi:molecular chaperone GrpE
VTLLEAIDELDRCVSMSGQEATSPLGQGVKMIRDGLLSHAAVPERVAVRAGASS